MQEVKIGLIGFGNVGHGLVQVLNEKYEQYKRELGLDFRITAISDIKKGCAVNPDGLPLADLVNSNDLDFINPAEHPGWNAIQMIHNAPTNIIVELSYTDLKTGEPAILHCREAILSGKHVITSNKGPVALHHKMLLALARENGVQIGVEGTVMSGTPALRLGSEILRPAGIIEIKGILNGTTNYILSKMEENLSFEEALKQAQNLGFAEADPSGDIEGMDTAGKISILAQMIFGTAIKPIDIPREGIIDITPEDITSAAKNNSRWKLIGSLKKTETGLEASVKPIMLSRENPLANVMGVMNAIQYKSDLLGETTLIGAGAGRRETACAIIEDIVAIMKEK